MVDYIWGYPRLSFVLHTQVPTSMNMHPCTQAHKKWWWAQKFRLKARCNIAITTIVLLLLKEEPRLLGAEQLSWGQRVTRQASRCVWLQKLGSPTGMDCCFCRPWLHSARDLHSDTDDASAGKQWSAASPQLLPHCSRSWSWSQQCWFKSALEQRSYSMLLSPAFVQSTESSVTKTARESA